MENQENKMEHKNIADDGEASSSIHFIEDAETVIATEELPDVGNVACIMVNGEDGATATGKPVKEEQKVFSQKLISLQEKTRYLREKLGLRRREMEQQTVMAQKNIALINANAKPYSKANLPMQTQLQKSANQETVPHAAKRRTQKTRRDLMLEVEGLQELLSQLTLQNPRLQKRANMLAQRNPKLRELDLFPTSRKADKSTEDTQSWSGRQPRESDMSNASTTTSERDTTTTNTANENCSQKERKRNRRNRKNNSKGNMVGKNQASELEDLAKYINTIVNEYLGDQKERAKELEFKGGINDLETHAQRLVQAGLGRIVEEEIRINRKNNRQSFINMSADREGSERDGIILLPVARRYAFEGDTVRAFVMNAGVATAGAVVEKKKSTENAIEGGKDNSFCIADDEDPFANEDSDSGDSEIDPNELDVSVVAVSDNCPKSFVIDIVTQTELRQIIGTISFKNATKLNGEHNYYKLKPHDMRIPMVYIQEESCALHITAENKNDICGLLYLAHVLETDENGHCIGALLQPVGKVGDLEAEIKAILLHNGLKDVRPYEERFSDLYSQPDAPVTNEELKKRDDLRKKCVFTIDPLTARDLDDALSVEKLSTDEYEVGVHISDVSYYLHEDCELDNIVKDRATSIYLVNEVIHMLPKTLCSKCSLLPGEDKFTFSVYWRMNLSGEILGKPRFSRSIINSCSQFAYEHAQKIIDNPDETFGDDDFPTICNEFTPVDISQRVRVLHTIAQEIRKKRYEGGALSIKNPKLRFNLDAITGEPSNYEVDGRQEANFLIEEYMLLANQSVARFIYDSFPDIAILRNHSPPLSKSMKNLKEKLASLGIDFDVSTSKSVFESMQRICRESRDPTAMDACLNTLLTKPMARAKYFCSEGKTTEADLWHYALSIPIYTHFTSPIRRYPDILVHRLLAAALNYCAPPKRTVDELHVIAKVCNDQKYNAKNAGDESITLFFKRYIKSQQSITLRAVVTEIFQHLVNVVTIETGHAVSINYKIQKVLVNTSNAPSYILISEKNSKNPPLKLQIFSTVDVKLVIWDGKICGFFASPDPKQRQLNSIEMSKKKQQQQLTNSASTSNRSEISAGARKPHSSSQLNEKEKHQPQQTRPQPEQASSSNPTKSKTKQYNKANDKRVNSVRESVSN